MSIRRWIRRIAVILALALVVCEGGLRLTALVLSRDDWRGLRVPAGGAIYAIGDSFTFGTGVERSEAYPAVLQALLRRSGAPETQVVNNGFPGLSSANALYAAARVLDEADPALLLVMTGWNANDTDFSRHLGSGRGASWPLALDHALDRLRIYRLLKQLLTYRRNALRLEDVELVPQAPAMELYDFLAYQQIAREHLRQIVALCRSRQVPLILLNYPYQRLPPNPWDLEYEYYHLIFGRTRLEESAYLIKDREPDESALHAVIREVGAQSHVPVLDLNAVFRRSGRDDLFQPDWHHPTAAGHRLIAEAIYARIAPSLAAADDAPEPF